MPTNAVNMKLLETAIFFMEVQNMFIDENKLNLMLARRAMSIRQLLKKAGIASQVIGHVKNGHKLTTKTVGKICNALECDPSELVKEV